MDNSGILANGLVSLNPIKISKIKANLVKM